MGLLVRVITNFLVGDFGIDEGVVTLFGCDKCETENRFVAVRTFFNVQGFF